MKIQNLAVIFIIIVLPISMVVTVYVQNQIETLELQVSYDFKLKQATADALKAFQLNTVNSSTSDLANSKIRDIEASVNSFFNSMANQFNMVGYNQDILQEYVQESPYDYDRNSILYLSQNVLSPKCQDHELYLNSLAQEIDQLIQVTNGRSLVLFTSKTDMNGVYERLKQKSYSFPLYIQEDGKNAENLKRNFQKEETSTLFATGSFWEGIDVAGSSLEQVIITKLPFPVVDPIMQEKASHYTNSLEEVYIPEMIIKLKQGAGRLIRSSQDKGIVSILDSRAKDYESYIMGNLPYQKKTERFEEVEKFAVENLQILAEDSSVKVKK